VINTNNQPKILIVDDDPINGVILEGYFQSDNYDIHFVDNGQKALKTVNELNPDLIMLDIMMPGMSGFEVCETLKNAEPTQDIPILFMTALSDGHAHKKAIESGGEGFIAKPFNEGLVRAYVKSFLRMKKIHDNVKHRLASSREFTSMTIHDLNNLHYAVSGNLELAMLEYDECSIANKYVGEALSVLGRTKQMLKKLGAIERLEWKEERLNLAQVNLIDLINMAAGLLKVEIKSKDLRFDLQETDFVHVHGDEELLLRVFLNLMDNAIKFAYPNTRIGFEVRKKKERCMEAIISNECHPVPEEFHESIFEKFKKGPNGKNRKRGTGLGLAFCKLAIERHGGRIWLESPIAGQESGMAVHFTLPSTTYETNPDY